MFKILSFSQRELRRNVGLREIISPQKMTAIDLYEGQTFFLTIKRA